MILGVGLLWVVGISGMAFAGEEPESLEFSETTSVDSLMEQAAGYLMDARIHEARELLLDAGSGVEGLGDEGIPEEALALLDDLAQREYYIAQAWREMLGREITLPIDGVREKVVLQDVQSPSQVVVTFQRDSEYGSITLRRVVNISELSLETQLRWLGAMPAESQALFRFLVEKDPKVLDQTGVWEPYLERVLQRRDRLRVIWFEPGDEGEGAWFDNDSAAPAPNVLRAILLDADRESRTVRVRRIDDGLEFVLSWDDLSEADLDPVRAWLREQHLQLVPGQMHERGIPGWGNHAYHYLLPGSDRLEDSPVLFLFAPAGEARRLVERLKPGFEEGSWILVAMEEAKPDPESEHLDQELRKQFEAVLEDFQQRVPHNQDRIYLAGVAGEGTEAFGITATVDYPFAGVMAMNSSLGGWAAVGGGLYRPYMAVAMVNPEGVQETQVWIDRDKQRLQGRRAEVRVFEFPGQTSIPPLETLREVRKWFDADWEERGFRYVDF